MRRWRRDIHLELSLLCGLGIVMQFWNSNNLCKSSVGVVFGICGTVVEISSYADIIFELPYRLYWISQDATEPIESRVDSRKHQWNGMTEIIDPELLETKWNPDACWFVLAIICHNFPKIRWVIFSVCTLLNAFIQFLSAHVCVCVCARL